MKEEICTAEMIVYDFSNLNLQENSTDNCFGCDSCNCDCVCDGRW